MKARTFKETARYLHLPAPESDGVLRGVAVDSRAVESGNLYFAMKGETTDGHLYLAEARERGAAAAVVRKDYNLDEVGIPLFKSSDVLASLQSMARNLLKEASPLVAAITGSVGKTITKEFLADLLSSQYRTTRSPGNQNSQIGMPLAILNTYEEEEEILVLEMGMSYAGEIRNLASIAPPDLALLTGVESVHSSNFNGIEEIAAAKAEIFSEGKTQYALVPRELLKTRAVETIRKAACYTFSLNDSKADFSIQGDECGFSILHQGKQYPFGQLPVPGKHNLHNFLAAAAAAHLLGVGWDKIREKAQELSLPPRRFERIVRGGIVFINDSYNAAVSSMKAALSTLPSPQPGCKKIAVLGEMKELGRQTHSSHMEIGRFSLDRVDRMLCLGEGCKPIYEEWKKACKPVELHDTLSALVSSLKQQVRQGDVVLLKGSNSNGLWRILDHEDFK